MPSMTPLFTASRKVTRFINVRNLLTRVAIYIHFDRYLTIRGLVASPTRSHSIKLFIGERFIRLVRIFLYSRVGS